MALGGVVYSTNRVAMPGDDMVPTRNFLTAITGAVGQIGGLVVGIPAGVAQQVSDISGIASDFAGNLGGPVGNTIADVTGVVSDVSGVGADAIGAVGDLSTNLGGGSRRRKTSASGKKPRRRGRRGEEVEEGEMMEGLKAAGRTAASQEEIAISTLKTVLAPAIDNKPILEMVSAISKDDDAELFRIADAQVAIVKKKVANMAKKEDLVDIMLAKKTLAHICKCRHKSNLSADQEDCVVKAILKATVEKVTSGRKPKTIAKK